MTVLEMESFFQKLNRYLNQSICPVIVVEPKGKYPITARGKKIVIVPDYFNDELFTDDDRKMMLTLFYSIMLLDNGDGTVRSNPEVFAKCICEELAMKYVPIDNLEATMRRIRRKLYCEVEYISYFSVGDKLRADIATRYQVEDIKLTYDGKVLITVKPIGHNAKEKCETKVYEEEVLYERCCKHGDHENERVYFNGNLFILSGPSCSGKIPYFLCFRNT